MSNKIKPWRRKDKKHYKRKLKFVKGKKPPPKILIPEDDKIDIR